ncbi:hypothetical protein AX17_005829 [Amanita inopinata Kibby_2008]|nr:hypothetical protein AX17_005829 [Amanita inopinata Kibby_2008]
MAVSIAGVGHPILNLLSIFSNRGDIKSILCFFTFCVVALVLAYLTNPSETSFRAYLTEQSFRQHLSQLDDGVDEKGAIQNHTTSSIRSTQSSVVGLSVDDSTSIRFAARASVSLRTPKHVFHSLGLFTVATMVPMAKPTHRQDRHQSSVITDSWYIGAFGKWWRGGIIEAWYQDVIARSKDEESWNSGVLNLTNLDVRHDYVCLPTSSQTISAHSATYGSPPRLRNRERSRQRSDVTLARSSTPPPLPKSASLPLHTSRLQPGTIEVQSGRNASPLPLQSNLILCVEPCNVTMTNPQVLSDQSSRLAELLRQITLSKNNVLALRSQVTHCQDVASQSHEHLQSKLGTHRERKRQEDAIKAELKSKTKSLDDSKRQAESSKREADKKLKTTQNIRDNATHQMVLLDQKIIQLQQQLSGDQEFVYLHSSQQTSFVRDLTSDIQAKRRQMKVTEQQILAQNQRARGLEDKLNKERERLSVLKNRLGIRRGDMQHAVDQNKIPPCLVLHPSATETIDSNNTTSDRQDQLKSLESCNINQPRPPTMMDGELLPIFTEFDALPSHHRGMMNCPTGKSTVHCFSNESEVSPTSHPTASASFIFSPDNRAASPVYDDYKPSPVDHARLKPFAPLSQLGWLPQANRDCMFSEKDATFSDEAWLPCDESPRRGLNPDAKEFRLIQKTVPNYAITRPDASLYDSLNPGGFRTDATSSATTSSSLLRAFAPSPAERQVLQRALNGTSNASLERLSSLGDVSTLTPLHIQAHPVPGPVAVPQELAVHSSALPSWLLVPHIHKVNFSPWDDEEQEQCHRGT